MNSAHWLAWVIIVWNIVGGIWELVDKPVTRRWNSNFYLVAVLVLSITLLVLSVSVVA